MGRVGTEVAKSDHVAMRSKAVDVPVGKKGNKPMRPGASNATCDVSSVAISWMARLIQSTFLSLASRSRGRRFVGRMSRGTRTNAVSLDEARVRSYLERARGRGRHRELQRPHRGNGRGGGERNRPPTKTITHVRKSREVASSQAEDKAPR